MEAVVLVDIQNDFMPTGSLPVPDGNSVVPIANKLIKHFDLVVATQDWHPHIRTSRFWETLSLTRGKLILIKQEIASKRCAEAYRQHILWPNFPKVVSFHFSFLD